MTPAPTAAKNTPFIPLEKMDTVTPIPGGTEPNIPVDTTPDIKFSLTPWITKLKLDTADLDSESDLFTAWADSQSEEYQTDYSDAICQHLKEQEKIYYPYPYMHSKEYINSDIT